MDLSNVRWRKASRSSEQGDQCIEVGATLDGVAVRDSKNPEGPKLIFGQADFSAIAQAIKKL
ncbi:DUF397 domain-containing protein [Actinomadura sp. CNU-125]|uniref:DUF397 domain-containing protein n=1 Tax=Actinomadura sp. CNU-125 TaxID=1904961 RepID=UPI00095A7C79|nr:DUF397 domain-containing protein [Actinomadura sp. CNU-125]OLT37834.1 DUF397 domain-containing protein [Actinomadura sp. CNU-125]